MPIPLLAAGAARIGQMCSSKVLSKLNPLQSQSRLLGGGPNAAGGNSPMDLMGNVANVASLASLLPSGGHGGHDKPKSPSGIETGL